MNQSIIINENQDNNLAEKSSWEKYKLIYLLIGGSFFFTLLIVLLSHAILSSRVKKLTTWSNIDRFFNSRSLSHDYQAGEFILTDELEKKKHWVEEIIFQTEVQTEFQNWVNSIKYLPRYRIGHQPENEKHALLYGPPGSGKSYLAEQMGINEARAYIFAKFGTETFAGSAQQKMNKVMEGARYILSTKGPTKPVIIIIDEIDSCGRKDSLSPSTSNEVNGILTMIDEIKRDDLNIILIGITNYPEMLDPALKRTGRLGRQIYIPYPTVEEIKKMVDYLRKDLSSQKIGAYKHQVNKIKWDKWDDFKSCFIEWSSDFWPKVHQFTQEEFEKCKQAKVGISYTDIEMSIKDALATKISPTSQKIIPSASDFKKSLQKKTNDKIRDKKSQKPTPSRREIPVPEKEEEW